MELATAVTMDATDAAIKARQAREAFRQTEDERYRAVAEGYEALSAGVALIDLPAAIRQAGLDDDGRPRMAACRSDAAVCFCDPYDRRIDFLADRSSQWGRVAQLDRIIVRDFDGVKSGRSDMGALVPMVPAHLRPLGRRGRMTGKMLSLRHFVTMWEVEEGGWAARRARNAPRDPALLRHVGGGLYSVIAVWELTDLERLVLGG